MDRVRWIILSKTRRWENFSRVVLMHIKAGIEEKDPWLLQAQTQDSSETRIIEIMTLRAVFISTSRTKMTVTCFQNTKSLVGIPRISIVELDRKLHKVRGRRLAFHSNPKIRASKAGKVVTHLRPRFSNWNRSRSFNKGPSRLMYSQMFWITTILVAWALRPLQRGPILQLSDQDQVHPM